jgi:hypothetical protein
MPKPIPKLNPQWVCEARDYFLRFLRVTQFPYPVRNGNRGSEFDYPEWLIMFLAVLSVKTKIKGYRAIHRLAVQYWQIIIQGRKDMKVKPISERQLRDRLKKISYQSGRTPMFVLQIFPREYLN